MARRQTRRAVGVKLETHQRLKLWAARQHRSVSGVLEEIIAEKLDAEGIPVPEAPSLGPSRRRTTNEIIEQHFTF